MPLFDRLADDAPFEQHEAVSVRVLDREGVLASVQRELHRLCNTRSSLPMSKWDTYEPSVITYGIPDHAHLSPHDGGHRADLARLIGKAISAFEPRLREVRVTPLSIDPGRRERFRFRLDGLLVLGNVSEAVSFPMVL